MTLFTSTDVDAFAEPGGDMSFPIKATADRDRAQIAADCLLHDFPTGKGMDVTNGQCRRFILAAARLAADDPDLARRIGAEMWGRR